MGRIPIKKDSREKEIRDQEAKHITLLTLKENEEETRMKIASVTEKSGKRPGTLMVRPLLKIGLSPHNFALTCAIRLLNKLRLCSTSSNKQT